jgi:hypothetical protein
MKTPSRELLIVSIAGFAMGESPNYRANITYSKDQGSTLPD